MKHVFPLVIVLLFSCSPGGPSEPGWGAELVLKCENLPSDNHEAESLIERDTRTILKRLKLRGFPHARFTQLDDGRLKFRIPGATFESIKLLGGAFSTWGTLSLMAVADRSAQEKFSRSKDVPYGYKVYKNAAPEHRQDLPEYKPWDTDLLLLKVPSIVDEDMIVDAWPERAARAVPGRSWDAVFKLSSEGTKRLDEATGSLSKAVPPGLVAIVLDESVISTPRVMDERFGGQARVTGFKTEDEARTFAIILLSGGLTLKLVADPNPEEATRYYGTVESSGPQLKKTPKK